MEEREILSGVVNTLIEKPKYTFKLDVNWIPEPKRSLWGRITGKSLPAVEKEKIFTIYPCKVGNMHRVAGRAVLLPKELVQGDLSESVMPIMVKYRDDMVYIIASAIQNNHLEPEQDLIEFITNNADNIDILNGMNAALNGLEMESFLSSIVLAKGAIEVLKPETNPTDGSE